MSSRPVFLPGKATGALVFEKVLDFTWHAGFAPSQKKRNIAALHAAAEKADIAPVLEVSTKSEDPHGRELSAFNLQVTWDRDTVVAVEVAYQSSKVFSRGGPFLDLVSAEAGKAKRDPRLRESGALVGFRFAGAKYPLVPPTAFYDWLYIRALQRVPRLFSHLLDYVAYSDIEFNPARSLNCQARSCALAVALHHRGALPLAAKSFSALIEHLRAASPTRSDSAPLPWQTELRL